MLTGLNTEVQYQGTSYHVQTEDGGLAHPVITTLLFKAGAIFHSKKMNYGALGVTRSEEIKNMMKEQHKAMLLDLVKGKIISSPPAPPISPSPLEGEA